MCNPWASKDGQEVIDIIGWPKGLGFDPTCGWHWNFADFGNEAATAILNHHALKWLANLNWGMQIKQHSIDWAIRIGVPNSNTEHDGGMIATFVGAGESLTTAIISAVLVCQTKKGALNAN